MEISVNAYAKLNLSLDVLGKREDGYHELQMVMQTVELHDKIRIVSGTRKGMQVRTNLGYLPNDSRNIAAKASVEFAAETGIDYDGLMIEIEKRIPVCSGLGGGSADAAAVLYGLNKLYDTKLSKEKLAEIGLRTGADVPYCVIGGTALAEGVGEVLTPLGPLPDCHIIIGKPRVSVSTSAAFESFDCGRIQHRPDTPGIIKALESGSLADIARHMFNVFEPVVSGNHRDVRQIQHILIEKGALGASMSGTGPSVFGLFDDLRAAEAAAAALKTFGCEVFSTRNKK